MKQSIIHIALVVRDYDEANEFYCQKLNFTLIRVNCDRESRRRSVARQWLKGR